MSKRNQEQPQRNSSLRVRVVEVELNGGDSTIEEALRAVERLRQPATQVVDRPASKRLSPANNNGESNKQHPLFNDLEENDSEVFQAENLENADDKSGTVESHQPRRKRGDSIPKDYNAGIKPVGDVNFHPVGKQSLKEFFAEKAPGSDMDQILVFCHYMQHTVQCPQIGPSHILSAFKHVNKPVPKDIKQTIRNMKSKKAWLSFSDIDSICVTTEGDNRVEHQLSKGAADAPSGG